MTIIRGAAIVTVVLAAVIALAFGILHKPLSRSDSTPPVAAVTEDQARQDQPQGREWREPAGLSFDDGPIDLIIETGEGRFILRDQAAVRAAAQAGFPDYTADEMKLIFMSLLLLSPPGRDPDQLGLTFARDGAPLAVQKCMRPVCGRDVELRDHMAALIRDADVLASHSVSSRDYAEYRRDYARIQADPMRYGPIEPATPEDERPFPLSVDVTFPVIHGAGLTRQAARSHAAQLVAAFQHRFSARAADFDIAEPSVTMQSEDVFLMNCDPAQEGVIRDAQGNTVFPEDYGFASIHVAIEATPGFADALRRFADWGFLPRGPADTDLLDQRVVQARAKAGLEPGCTSVHGTDAGDDLQLSLWPTASYYIYWTEIQPQAR
ncbi:MAG: hypothetical protein Q4G25_02535 [Paracoccus sp. (in: a-proteobacteria)]|nr:hypothetical protein [Paracoccus sp. (in: a-proteobacteria)]